MDFWCCTAGSVNLDTYIAFHRQGLCLTIIVGFFTLGGGGGGGDLFLIVDTRHIFSISWNHTTLLDFAPFTEPTQLTPNTVSIYQPCTHTHEMRCFLSICNGKKPLPVISCYMFNEHYIEQFITRIFCQVPWIIISKTYNLHPFMLIYITPIYQHIYNTFSML